jgi:hypothetical protein
VRKRNVALEQALDHMRRALAADAPGQEFAWTRVVSSALARLDQALGQHRAAAISQDGPLAEVDDTRPTLVRQADELCSQQEVLLVQVRALEQEVERAAAAFDPTGEGAAQSGAPVPDFGAIRQQGEQIVSALEENLRAEARLVLDSVNTDIGVGD